VKIVFEIVTNDGKLKLIKSYKAFSAEQREATSIAETYLPWLGIFNGKEKFSSLSEICILKSKKIVFQYKRNIFTSN